MARLIIFGERPGPNTDPERPLFPHTTTGAAARLIELLGWSQEEYLSQTIRYNVADDPWTSTSDPKLRRRVQERLVHHIERDHGKLYPKFLFLGRSAGNGGPSFLRRLDFGKEEEGCMVIPHPSGRNRFYNSAEDTARITAALRHFTEDCR